MRSRCCAEPSAHWGEGVNRSLELHELAFLRAVDGSRLTAIVSPTDEGVSQRPSGEFVGRSIRRAGSRPTSRAPMDAEERALEIEAFLATWAPPFPSRP